MKKSLHAVALSVSGAVVASLLAAVAPGAVADDGSGASTAAERSPLTVAEQPPQMAAGLIVKTKAGTAVSGLRAAAGRALADDVAVRAMGNRVRAYRSEPVPVAVAVEAAARVAERPDVLWAVPNHVRWATDTSWPTPVQDPMAAQLRNVWDTRSAADFEVSSIGVNPWPAGGYGTKAPALWRATQGRGVVVAVLDTGVRLNHPDLAPNLVSGHDFVSDAGLSNDGDGMDSNPDDPGDWTPAQYCPWGGPAENSSWHGTHVAGTVAAAANTQGVVGMAPGAKIQPVRVLARCGGTDADITTAVKWAAGAAVPGVTANPTPAKVINLSLGGEGTCTAAWNEAIQTARGRGAAVVVALGNEGVDASGSVPANCKGVIGVASTSDYGDRAPYSNYGSRADVAAPGGDTAWHGSNGVLSTVDIGSTSPQGPGYGWMQGTSMAAPAVAGVAALLASVGRFTPAQLESAIRAAVTPFPTASAAGFVRCTTSTCGTGVIDATKVPAPVGAPTISGSAAPGQTLTASATRWTGPSVGRSFTWYANGRVVGQGSSYVVTSQDQGTDVVARERVASGPFAPIGADSAPVRVSGDLVPTPTPTPTPAPGTSGTVTRVGAAHTFVEYKGADKPSLVASVKTPAGDSVRHGTLSLQAKTAGKGWRTIRTTRAGGHVSFSTVLPKKNTSYRTLYRGGTDSVTGTTYEPSQSRNLKIWVARKVTVTGNNRTFAVKGRVMPNYGKKKIVVKVSKRINRGYTKLRTIRTTRKGVYRTKLPQRRGTWYYRLIVKKDKNYAGVVLTVPARVRFAGAVQTSSALAAVRTGLLR